MLHKLHRQRWWMRLFAASVALLTLSFGILVIVSWAFGRVLPKADQMAFMSQRYYNFERQSFSWDIFVKDIDRHIDWALTRWQSNERYPAWSPDGQQIAFHSDRAGYWDLYVMDADGRNLRQLTNMNPAANLTDPNNLDNPNATPRAGTRYTSYSEGIAMAAWSPDGQSIGFHADYNGEWDLVIVDLNGEVKHELTYGSGDDVLMSWSPDGKRIAFSSERDGTMEIYVMEIARPVPTRLTGSDEVYIDPYQSSYNTGSWHAEWSPDGQQIVYASSLNGLDDIYIMNADGTNIRQLTDSLAEDHNPIWTSDGRRVVFASDRAESSGINQIYMMDTTGANLRQLTSGAPSDAPAWRP